jgi:hypothetical protein
LATHPSTFSIADHTVPLPWFYHSYAGEEEDERGEEVEGEDQVRRYERIERAMWANGEQDVDA